MPLLGVEVLRDFLKWEKRLNLYIGSKYGGAIKRSEVEGILVVVKLF